MAPTEAIQARRSAWVILLALAPLSCGDEEGEATTCSLSARPMAAATGFDANSDGVLDVADGAWLLARNFRGGEDIPCPAAVEAYGDAMDDSATAYASWYALLSGTAVPELAPGTCEAPEDIEAACGDGLALSVSASEEVTGAAGSTVSFAAEVRFVSPTLPVEAWSLSLEAEGCTVSAASLAGTWAADRRDDPPGSRDGGLGAADLSTTGGAVSLVVLDPIGGGTIDSETAVPILALTVSADVGSSCGTCTLRLNDGQVGRGRALSNVVSSGGRSYAPETSGATVRVCPEG